MTTPATASPNASDVTTTPRMESITLGGGCFWCLDAAFRRIEGVTQVESGYSNGRIERPSYEQVCGGDTGHAEVVRVTFDPARVGLREVLIVFFTVHDPTTLNRQGHDIGTQYRSGIYWHDEAQAATARAVMAEVAEAFPRPLVTELEPLRNYWPAEAYHQDYYAQHAAQGYCAAVIAPKLAKLRKVHTSLLRAW